MLAWRSLVSVGILLSPNSGRVRRDPGLADRLRAVVGARGVVRMCATLEDLDAALRDLRGTSTIAICGGDGTNHIVITRAVAQYGAESLPTFAFLRGGTMNTVANAVGVPRQTPEQLVAAILEERGRYFTRRTLRIGPELGFLFGTGAVHGFLAEYYRNGQPTPLDAAETLLRGAASAAVGGRTVRRMCKPFRGHVSFDDGTRWAERDYLAIAGGAVDQIGLGFRPFYRCQERPDGFHLLGIHASPMGFVRVLPRVFRGVGMGERSTYEAVVDAATLHGEDGEVSYMIDGDLRVSRGPLRVSLGPLVRICAP